MRKTFLEYWKPFLLFHFTLVWTMNIYVETYFFQASNYCFTTIKLFFYNVNRITIFLTCWKGMCIFFFSLSHLFFTLPYYSSLSYLISTLLTLFYSSFNPSRWHPLYINIFHPCPLFLAISYSCPPFPQPPILLFYPPWCSIILLSSSLTLPHPTSSSLYPSHSFL